MDIVLKYDATRFYACTTNIENDALSLDQLLSKMRKAGMRNICIAKLMLKDHDKSPLLESLSFDEGSGLNPEVTYVLGFHLYSPGNDEAELMLKSAK